ncbi:MAG: M6 family metalloprotease domain-containing protein [Bacteroidales bacterium]|nr:M6 family metalloprotease domain-containing protein [Bacteroidales bacterium]
MKKLILASLFALIGITAFAEGETGKWDEKLVTGTRHIPTILVQFSDVKFTVSNPAQSFNDLLNKKGYSDNDATGSAQDYWVENSGGKFTPIFDVYGPVTLDKASTYYGAGNTSQEKTDECLLEAARLLDAEVDFSQYDYNNDGYIDPVVVIFAGHGQDAKAGGGQDKIKPHQESVGANASGGRVFDGKSMFIYCISPELSTTSTDASRMAGIGIICHEFGHTLGLSDYYKFQSFALMAYGCDNNYEATPPYLTVVERDQLRWLSWKDIPVLKAGQTTISSVKDGTAFRSNTNQYGEFFIYEYRSGQGWDEAIPSGLLVYHIDRSVAMNTEHPLECLVPAADPSNWNHQGLLADYLYPGTKNVTTFNPVDWTGNPTMYQISNIHKSGDAIVFNTELTATRVLEGRVVDALGEPQANYGVEAWLLADAGDGTHAFTDHDIQVLTTDSRGKFTLTIDSSFDDPKMGPVVGALIKAEDYSETVYMYSPTQTLEIIIGGQGQDAQTWSSYTDLSSATAHDMHTQVDYANPNQIMFAAKIPASQLPSGGGVVSSVSFVVSTSKNYIVVDAGTERILTFEVPSNYVTGRYGQLVTIDLKSEHARFPGGKDLYVGFAADVAAGYQFPAPFDVDGNPGNFFCSPLDLSSSTWTDFCWWNKIIPVDFSYFPIGEIGPGPVTGDDPLVALGLNAIADPGNGVYQTGDVFPLQVGVAAGLTLTSATWTLDGQAVSGDSITLTKGSHIIVAVTHYSDGSKETLELRLKAQ